jgi:hypothetical protein
MAHDEFTLNGGALLRVIFNRVNMGMYKPVRRMAETKGTD